MALRAAENGYIAVTPSFFVRDIFFFVLVYVYLYVILFFIGHLNFFVSIGFFSIYVVYVIIVVIQARGAKVENEENENEAEANMNALDFLTAGKHAKHAAGTRYVKMNDVVGEFKRMHGKKPTQLEDIDLEEEDLDEEEG